MTVIIYRSHSIFLIMVYKNLKCFQPKVPTGQNFDALIIWLWWKTCQNCWQWHTTAEKGQTWLRQDSWPDCCFWINWLYQGYHINQGFIWSNWFNCSPQCLCWFVAIDIPRPTLDHVNMISWWYPLILLAERPAISSAVHVISPDLSCVFLLKFWHNNGNHNDNIGSWFYCTPMQWPTSAINTQQNRQRCNGWWVHVESASIIS